MADEFDRSGGFAHSMSRRSTSCGIPLFALCLLTFFSGPAFSDDSFIDGKGSADRRLPLERPVITRKKQASPEIVDIALPRSGTLSGRFVDAKEAPLDGAVVTLLKEDHTLARTTTDTDGNFQIKNVPSGVFRLSCGSTAGWVRCWTPDAAPPNAIAIGDGLTFQDGVVRGQAALLVPAFTTGTLVTGAATTGAVVGGVSLAAGSATAIKSTSLAPPPTSFGPVTELSPSEIRNLMRTPPVHSSLGGAFQSETHAGVDTPSNAGSRGPRGSWKNDLGDPRDAHRAPQQATFAAPPAAALDGFTQPNDGFAPPASP